jgi:hypothetical protein
VRAWCFGGRMVIAGVACMVHALLPFLFVRTGSQAIEELHERMLATKRRAALSATPLPPASGSHSPLTSHRAPVR